MDAELLENAAAAARILGISVPQGLLRRAAGALLDAPAGQTGGALAASVRDAGAAAKRADAAGRGAKWLASAAGRAAETEIPRASGAGAGEEAGAPRQARSGGGMGAPWPVESYKNAPESYELSHQMTKTDMAAVSRYFERDARRYGQEG